jgi:hypothetical protein
MVIKGPKGEGYCWANRIGQSYRKHGNSLDDFGQKRGISRFRQKSRV